VRKQILAGPGARAKGLLLIILSILLVWRMLAQTQTAEIPVDDFVAYWTAIQLQLQEVNPYSPDRVLALERSAGMEGDEPLVMMNPPWTIAFLLPFGVLNYPAGRVVWLILGLGLTVFSARGIWIVYDGPGSSQWVALALAFCFVPLLISLALGQITPLILAGIAGFLYFQRSHPVLSGSFLVLLSLKPHLFYLLWVALFLWILQQRRWRIFIGAVAGWTAALAVAMIWNPAVVAQYIEVTRNQPPVLHWRTPTYGTLLRASFGMEYSWLQFVPMIAGLAWLLYYRQSRRSKWDWKSEMPLLILVSLTTTSYVWFYDQMVILPAILQVAVAKFAHAETHERRPALAVFAVMNLILVVFVILKLPPLYYQWSFTAWLVWYLLYDRKRHSLPQSALVGENGT